LADTVIVPETVWPEVGEVMKTEGGVVSAGGVVPPPLPPPEVTDKVVALAGKEYEERLLKAS
jgi:hypothetical protein